MRVRLARLLAVALPVAAAAALACDKSPTEPTPPPVCTYAASPASLAFGAPGGVAPVSVATDAGCAWTSQSGASWLSFSGSSTGAGAGTVTVVAAANSETAARTGTVTVAGKAVAVQQDGLAPCTYAIAPTSARIGKNADGGQIAVTTDAHCGWTAVSTANWLHVTSGASGSGPATLSWTADANGAPLGRTGTITIAGLVFTVEQDGDVSACTYTVSPVSFSSCMVWIAESTSTVSTQDGCPWEATPADGWLTITEGSSGSGSGTIRFRGSDNWLAPRTSLVKVRWPTATAGQNLQVAQAGCHYGVSTHALSFAATGGTSAFDVVQQSDPIECGGPLQNACVWSAESSAAWVSVSTTTHIGDDRVTVTVAANTTGAPRSATITVRDQIVTITQN